MNQSVRGIQTNNRISQLRQNMATIDSNGDEDPREPNRPPRWEEKKCRGARMKYSDDSTEEITIDYIKKKLKKTAKVGTKVVARNNSIFAHCLILLRICRGLTVSIYLFI
jgi:hypothetical protein